MINEATLKELETACQRAKDMASAFNEAVKAQAEKHDLDPQALGKYIRARVNDKLEKFDKEQDTMEQLQLFHGEVAKGIREGRLTGEAA